MPSGRSNHKRYSFGGVVLPVQKSETTPSEALETGVVEVMTKLDSTSMIESSTLAEKWSDSVENETVIRDGEIPHLVSKFQAEIEQKDELITALIGELEQAVEQLDRFQRTGTGRNSNVQAPPASTSHGSSAETPIGLSDDLRRMAEEWGHVQPGAALERIEAQLASVYSLMQSFQPSNFSNGNLNQTRCEAPSEAVTDFEDRIRRMSFETENDGIDETVNVTLDESSPSWEAIKNQILSNEFAVSKIEHQKEDSSLLKLIAETPTPREINFDLADINELKQAIVERDSYIVQLNRLFRTRNTLALPDDWSALANVPAEMQVRVESLIEHLDVQVRLGEVEMSLERARLARERSQIQGEREVIEKHMRRLGLSSLADLDNISAATGTAGDRRWMRFIGPGSR